MNKDAADPSNGWSVRSEAPVSKFAGDFNMTAVIVVIFNQRRVFVKENAVRYAMDIVALLIGSYIVIIVMVSGGLCAAS